MTFLSGDNLWILEAYLKTDLNQLKNDRTRAENLLRLMGKIDKGI